MGSWARKFIPEKLLPVRWKGLPPGLPRDVAQEQAEKTAALADAVNHLPVMSPDFIMPWWGEACPPGWELVAEMEGRVMFGTTEAAGDVGTTGGSATHTHDIGHGHTASADAAPDHTHGIFAAGDHDHTIGSDAEDEDMQNAADGNVSYVEDVNSYTGLAGAHDHGGATGNGGSHTHAITVNAHAGSSGSGSSLPPHVKVLFCRRKV